MDRSPRHSRESRTVTCSECHYSEMSWPWPRHKLAAVRGGLSLGFEESLKDVRSQTATYSGEAAGEDVAARGICQGVGALRI